MHMEWHNQKNRSASFMNQPRNNIVGLLKYLEDWYSTVLKIEDEHENQATV